LSDFNPEWIIVHCTATTPEMDYVDARWVDREHRARGWLMCGYHEVITRAAQRQNARGGYPTRPLTRPGAHVGGCGAEWNRKTIGISMAGGIDSKGNPEDNFTSDQYDALVEAILEYREEFNIPLDHVIGHRDLIKMTNAAPKACPCFSVRSFISQSTDRFGGHVKFKRKNRKGDPLRIPEKLRIKRGDTLSQISKTYGISVSDIARWNYISDPDNVNLGQVISLRPS
jgi:hypothetical protein